MVMNNIPEIEYAIQESDMTPEQLNFYNIVENSLSKGEFIEVENNDWYIELYIQKLINNLDCSSDLEKVRDELLHIDKLYPTNDNFFISAKDYSNECLIGLKRYDDFLKFSVVPEICDYGMNVVYELRLNVQKLLGLSADPLDIYRLQMPKNSKLIKDNQEKYKEYLIAVYNEYASKYGGWFTLIENRFEHIISISNYQILNSYILPGNFEKPAFDFKIVNYSMLVFGIDGLNSILRPLNTKVENLLRKEHGMKPKDVAWFMETYLFEQLQKEFSETEVIQHGKPFWLGKQHFDIWIPEWKIAIEFHGPQHFDPVEIWGGEKALEATKLRDQKKINLSIENGVELIIVRNNDFENPIERIRKILESRKDSNI